MKKKTFNQELERLKSNNIEAKNKREKKWNEKELQIMKKKKYTKKLNKKTNKG